MLGFLFHYTPSVNKRILPSIQANPSAESREIPEMNYWQSDGTARMGSNKPRRVQALIPISLHGFVTNFETPTHRNVTLVAQVEPRACWWTWTAVWNTAQFTRNLVMSQIDNLYYSDVKWDRLIGSKSEGAGWDGTTLEGIRSSFHPRRRSNKVCVTSHYIFLNAMWGLTFYFCLSAQIHAQTAYSMIICIKLLICRW